MSVEGRHIATVILNMGEDKHCFASSLRGLYIPFMLFLHLFSAGLALRTRLILKVHTPSTPMNKVCNVLTDGWVWCIKAMKLGAKTHNAMPQVLPMHDTIVTSSLLVCQLLKKIFINHLIIYKVHLVVYNKYKQFFYCDQKLIKRNIKYIWMKPLSYFSMLRMCRKRKSTVTLTLQNRYVIGNVMSNVKYT